MVTVISREKQFWLGGAAVPVAVRFKLVHHLNRGTSFTKYVNEGVVLVEFG